MKNGNKKATTRKNKSLAPVSLVAMDNSSIFAEQCRIVLNNIKFSSSERPIKSIAITSSGQGEGKSTISANLAIVASENNKRVLLVDCDLRRPTVGLSFILSSNQGLSNILTSDLDTIDTSIQDSGIKNLSIITSGPKPPNPSELLYSAKMEKFMSDVYDKYDLIIYDCPPVLGMTDTQRVASQSDGVLLVAREDITNKEAIGNAKEMLLVSESNILGVVYNSKTKAQAEYYY